MGTAHIGTLVMVDAEPAKSVKNDLDCTFDIAFSIGISI
jgi:hypothetical protein